MKLRIINAGWWLAAGLAVALVLGGCAKKEPATAADAVAIHKDEPPHGGTVVDLGDDVYHLEFVFDPATGTLSAYVLDDEMEDFVRAEMPSFEVTAKSRSGERTLVFHAVANSATGETVGDTSLFQTEADWLKTDKDFHGVIKGVTVEGTDFTEVVFNFPAIDDEE